MTSGRIRAASAAILLLCCATAQAVTPEKLAKIDQTVREFHDKGRFGGAVLVADGGRIVYEKGFGWANAEWQVPNGPKVKYRLGSITKQFTSMIIMQLVSEGKVKLEGNITDYLPYYRKDTGSRVSVHHLLTHTSGIPSYTNSPRVRELQRMYVESPAQFVKGYCSGDLQWEPGTKYAYNNSGYFILGAIIEQVTGKKYEDVLQERIFTPLAMTDTGYDRPEKVIRNRASGYERALDGELQNAAFLDMDLPYAAGSLYSTVEDLLKWDQALYTERLLPEPLKQKMWTPVLQSYGYGWIITEPKPGEAREFAIWHNGGINGFTSQFIRHPKSKLTVIVLGNYPAPTGPVASAIETILHDGAVTPIKRSALDALRPALYRDGLAAKKKATELRTNPEYEFNEAEFNQFGYALLRGGKVKQAIDVFLLNVDAFPTSSNVYDSLAEAYGVAGEKELAVKNYQRAVELDPTNANAIEQLKKLKGN